MVKNNFISLEILFWSINFKCKLKLIRTIGKFRRKKFRKATAREAFSLTDSRAWWLVQPNVFSLLSALILLPRQVWHFKWLQYFICFEGNTIFTSGNQGRRLRMPRSLFHSALIWHYWLSSSPILASPPSSLLCGLTIFRIPIFRLYTHLNRLAGKLLQRQSVSVLYSVWLQGILYYSPYIHFKMRSTNVKVIILYLAYSHDSSSACHLCDCQGWTNVSLSGQD